MLTWVIANWKIIAVAGAYLLGAFMGADLMYLHYELKQEAQEAKILAQTQKAATESYKIGKDLENAESKFSTVQVITVSGNKFTANSVSGVSRLIDAGEAARKSN